MSVLIRRLSDGVEKCVMEVVAERLVENGKYEYVKKISNEPKSSKPKVYQKESPVIDTMRKLQFQENLISSPSPAQVKEIRSITKNEIDKDELERIVEMGKMDSSDQIQVADTVSDFKEKIAKAKSSKKDI